ncbi:CDP-diacylglycerol--glycerol-3-phosphate 3-phosphatidyltransferase [Microbacterium sp. APC 3898]|jgi:CDP-diacylglycerol--glycerol-3-phosphate 3-phosphatidyltransferase|uniref:CDP-diacylglycerol--glycerol-3-phosphate 3-phosphatidyltransferase n=2 Tax=Planococcus TaxID=1372 RepID=A0ABT7ZGC2_9BACL|nr:MULTISPECIES: CDP-diacylglycerol--glycerol-3-phosphate 3-phosphatidyltransferase [Terrabacteria group]MBD8013949.1 CDP-diacylglycerol--glycerol-3-phosphate 3-phosphatidyltransferase [Planococcus wigleyi]MDN3426190.1 CDP-diacylglycerol--glycerol-3-phosphate 3-phosphatidyltransferase [Planococcus sp. APC 4016]MDN3437783.1 CDP-diacylglycerol--glycerol-3-phosphate 3-phosphatidyltransferase [Planococcus sp. APC 3900]MDN3497887.1 CDP-diacylglycerol--glycerol-3-phosphate 3-phosphatidyltransferase [
MNIPNQITISRILLIPVFMVVMLAGFDWGNITLFGAEMPVTHFVGGLIFIFASLTDWVDGYYARKYNLVTTFGKFLDPLADKLLVSAALIILVELGFAASWIVIIIISREFAVTGLRLVLAGEGEVVAAGSLGKIKTTAQILAIAALLLHNTIFTLVGLPFGEIMLYIALIFTVWSGWDYFYANRRALMASK